MKRLLQCALMTGLVLAPVSAQILTVSPAQPRVGERITVTYNPTFPGAALSGKAPISGEALVVLSKDKDAPILVEFTMEKRGKSWTGGFELRDERARLLLFRVLSGGEVDGNGGNAWNVMVSGPDGKPLEGARVRRAGFLVSGILDFKHEKEYPAAYAELAQEQASFPDNPQGFLTEWSIRLRRDQRSGENLAKIKSALGPFTARFDGDEETMENALTIMEQAGEKGRADSIRSRAIAKNPAGRIAELTALQGVYREQDPLKRAVLAEKFLAGFPGEGMTRESMLAFRVSSYMQAKEVEKATAALAEIKSPNAMLLNNVAWGLAERGEKLDQAALLAKQGVEILRNPPGGERPTYMSTAQWERSRRENLGMVLDTYGAVLLKLGKGKEAAAAMEEAVALSGGEAEYTERLLEAYLMNGDGARAITAGMKAVERGKTTEALMERLRKAYVSVKGSEAGYAERIADAKRAGAGELKRKLLKSRLHTRALQWSLKDTEGRSIALKDLKGKVVVVDFWATWCGPCKMSFPTLQKVHDRYRSNPSVVILAFDTWERVAGKEREELVKKFIAENKYTFRVVYDEGMVEKYGVEGIPTKFVIDKRGNLAFKSIGFNGADEMYNELTAQLDLLLGE